MPTHAWGGEGREGLRASTTKYLLLTDGAQVQRSLLIFSANHGFPLVNAFFNTLKSGASRTFGGHGQGKRTDYILGGLSSFDQLTKTP